MTLTLTHHLFSHPDLTSFGVALTGLAMAWGHLRHRLVDVPPVAYDAVVEGMEDGVIVLDARGRVVALNPSAQRILGCGPEELGRPVQELFPGRLEALGRLGDLDVRTEITLGEGAAQRYFDLRLTPLHDQSERLTGHVIVLHDATERKRTKRELEKAKEAAEAANQAKSEFMSVASHELRTPVTSVKGYADLLAKGTMGPINEAQAQFLDTIRSNAERMAVLASDLSDIARIEAGRLRIDVGTVDVIDVVTEVADAMRARIEEEDQTLTLDTPGDLPAVRADRDRLAQVLTNLLGNAHKFTPSGGRIIVRAEHPTSRSEGACPERSRGEAAEDFVHVAVEDDGIGIRPEEQERVFEKFYRSEDREASQAPGSGLGLSIARNLIEMQGGRIWLESTFRQGTTVHVTMPVAKSTDVT